MTWLKRLRSSKNAKTNTSNLILLCVCLWVSGRQVSLVLEHVTLTSCDSTERTKHDEYLLRCNVRCEASAFVTLQYT